MNRSHQSRANASNLGEPMMFICRLFVVIVACVFLAACQTDSSLMPSGELIDGPESTINWQTNTLYFSDRARQVKSLRSWRYSAKVGITTPERKEQANLIWEYQNQINDVRLYGPLGVGAVELQFDGYGVSLTDNRGRLYRGSSAEELLTRITGWPIPIDALSYWIFALPAEQSVFKYKIGEHRQLSKLDQLGWLIEYLDYRQIDSRSMVMPRKIVATKVLPNSDGGIITVKLITKNWK